MKSIRDLRVLPALVVDLVFKGALLVVGVLVANVQDFSIVKNLMMEAEDLLILAIHGNRSHFFSRRKIEDVRIEVGMKIQIFKLKGVEKMLG